MSVSLINRSGFFHKKQAEKAPAPVAKKTHNNVLAFIPAPKPTLTASQLEHIKTLEKQAAQRFITSVAALKTGLFPVRHVAKAPKPEPMPQFTPTSK